MLSAISAASKDRGVAFVVIGSIAARWQDVPLDLTDVDVVIDNELDNLARLPDALDELGFSRYGAKHHWGMKQGDIPELIGRQPTTVFVRGTDTHEEELDVLTQCIDDYSVPSINKRKELGEQIGMLSAKPNKCPSPETSNAFATRARAMR